MPKESPHDLAACVELSDISLSRPRSTCTRPPYVLSWILQSHLGRCFRFVFCPFLTELNEELLICSVMNWHHLCNLSRFDALWILSVFCRNNNGRYSECLHHLYHPCILSHALSVWQPLHTPTLCFSGQHSLKFLQFFSRTLPNSVIPHLHPVSQQHKPFPV